MTSPEIVVGSCWVTLFMVVYGLWIASDCIKSISVSQVILVFVIGIDTGKHGTTFPCCKRASALPLALFSCSILQFNLNNKETV